MTEKSGIMSRLSSITSLVKSGAIDTARSTHMQDLKSKIQFNEAYTRVLYISYELAAWVPGKIASQKAKLSRAEAMCKPFDRVCEVLKDVNNGVQTNEWGTEEVTKVYEEVSKEGVVSTTSGKTSEDKRLAESQKYVSYFLRKGKANALEKCLYTFTAMASAQHRICDTHSAIIRKLEELDASRESKTSEAIVESQKALLSLEKMSELKAGLKTDKKGCEEYVKRKDETTIGYANEKLKKLFKDLYVLRKAMHGISGV